MFEGLLAARFYTLIKSLCDGRLSRDKFAVGLYGSMYYTVLLLFYATNIYLKLN